MRSIGTLLPQGRPKSGPPLLCVVSVAETAFVIPAKAGIQFLGCRPLLPAFAGTSLPLRKQGQG